MARAADMICAYTKRGLNRNSGSLPIDKGMDDIDGAANYKADKSERVR